MPRLKLSHSGLARESGLDRRTLDRILADAGESPDSSGKYEIAQLVRALRAKGDRKSIEAEKLRKTSEEADAVALANAQRRGELVPVADFVKAYHRVLVRMKQTVMNSKELPEKVKAEVLGHLSQIHEEEVEES